MAAWSIVIDTAGNAANVATTVTARSTVPVAGKSLVVLRELIPQDATPDHSAPSDAFVAELIDHGRPARGG